MLISLKLIDRLFLKLPLLSTNPQKAACWEKWDVALFSEILTRQGFEVESTELRGSALSSVVVGRIVSTEKHPKADKLQVCQVQVSATDTRQIVCGAPNARPGLHVAVALPGAFLPNGLAIKPSKIRDVESLGMLCSREELGLPLDVVRDGDGIWELSSESSGGIADLTRLDSCLGTPVFIALGLDDVLLELNVTPNRPDMLSHEGAARELFAGLIWAGAQGMQRLNVTDAWGSVCRAEVIQSDAEKTEQIQFQTDTFTATNAISVPAFFVGLDHVQVTSTPAWMRAHLEALGQKSVNSVVDACNLILLCFAQPNHAFDLSKLAKSPDGKRCLTLRLARQDEHFLGLDAKERSLQSSDCVVADCESAQALLGVIGGDRSKVEDSTASIILEFANPHPVLVRRTSRRHGRKTDSSFAFEKGIDVWQRFAAAAMLVGLLNEMQRDSGQSVQYRGTLYPESKSVDSSQMASFFPKDFMGREPLLQRSTDSHTVIFHATDVVRRVGAELIPFDRQLSLLESLGFVISRSGSSDEARVLVPSWRRLDVVGAADLVEEIVRVVGIDHVPSHPLAAPTQLSRDDAHLSAFEAAASRLVMLGYHETAGFHFMRADDWKRMQQSSINAFGEPVALLNPIIKDEPILQTTLVCGLLRKVAHNLSYGTKRGQLFEISRTFQNSDLSRRRVFEDNGHLIGLAKELSAQAPDALNDYAPQFALKLSHEEMAHQRPGETPRVAGVVFGSEEEKEWLNDGQRAWSFHKIGAHVAEVVSVFSCAIELEPLPEEHPMFSSTHPGRSAAVIAISASGRTPVGWVGQFHPAVMRNYEVEADCFGFELNLALCLQKQKEQRLQQAPARGLPVFSGGQSRLPSVERDFAFLVTESLPSAQLVDSISNAIEAVTIDSNQVPARLISARVFDLYRGQGVPEGRKSVAVRVVLLPTERTLTDADIVRVSDSVVTRVVAECSATLRG